LVPINISNFFCPIKKFPFHCKFWDVCRNRWLKEDIRRTTTCEDLTLCYFHSKDLSANCSGSVKSPTYIKAHHKWIWIITWHSDHSDNLRAHIEAKYLQYPNVPEKQKTIQVLYVVVPLHIGTYLY
jgi:hypothetical protein